MITNAFNWLSCSAKQTQKLGEVMVRFLEAGSVICLRGDLGAGKTTFVKGLVQGLGLSADDVNSPTFVLMNVYEGQVPVFHFDLYRLNESSELEGLDLDEYMDNEGISVIEWSERLGDLAPDCFWQVVLEHEDTDESARRVSVGFNHPSLSKRAEEFSFVVREELT